MVSLPLSLLPLYLICSVGGLMLEERKDNMEQLAPDMGKRYFEVLPLRYLRFIDFC